MHVIIKLATLTTGEPLCRKSQFDLARKSFDEAILVADQLKYMNRLTGYANIFSMFLQAKQPKEALNHFNTRPEIRQYFTPTE